MTADRDDRVSVGRGVLERVEAVYSEWVASMAKYVEVARDVREPALPALEANLERIRADGAALRQALAAPTEPEPAAVGCGTPLYEHPAHGGAEYGICGDGYYCSNWPACTRPDPMTYGEAFDHDAAICRQRGRHEMYEDPMGGSICRQCGVRAGEVERDG